MTIKMHDSQVNTIEDIVGIIKYSGEFEQQNQKEAYDWIEQTLVKFRYAISLNKKEKGAVRQYIEKITGYSRAQVTRLISQYVKTGRVQAHYGHRHEFGRKYTQEDVKLLAQTDELHNFPNGYALKKNLERMYRVFKENAFERLSQISVAHIYNLRHTPLYQRFTKKYEKTKPSVSRNIGERRKPAPEGRPGYLRVDTVHQGDRDGEKGVYHINTVDEVTQFEFIGACEKISEAFLKPLLEKLMAEYPFVIIEFHSDNGSEYINGIVAKLLNKLLIALTKSRARRTNDNALVESKNGSVIRKWIGYGFIEQSHAHRINIFYFDHFNEYLNYHRPCGFSRDLEDPNKKGKIKKVYRYEDYMTPYEKFKSLKNAKQYLKPDITLWQLNKTALRLTDNAMAKQVQDQLTALNDDIVKKTFKSKKQSYQGSQNRG